MMLPHSLDRTILIHAPRDVVCRFFTDDGRWASWWGAGSTMDARPGGQVYVRHPNGVESRGEVIESVPPERLVFTYGFVSGQPIPVGASRVTIRLDEDGGATRLHLRHEFADAGARDHHVQGWRFQLSLFANAVANEVHAGAAALADRWFDAWAETDAAARRRAFTEIAAPGARFRDRYSSINGLEELDAHVAASQKFMPGFRLRRAGDVRHCQGTVIVDWTVHGSDGAERARGTNVMELGADGRITGVTGFWA